MQLRFRLLLPFPALWLGLVLALPASGAERQAVPPSSTDHWSFRPVARPAVPAVKDASWVRSPIDAFILARLEEAGLAPSPGADARTLVRRASFVLLGLPPTPEQIDSFARDTGDGAWKRLVDHMLASPHHGERWARHWLDVARFAETNGFETNTPRENAWHYRDWVIRALNDDMPYDRFVRAQLAGDTLGEDVALGFLVAGPYDTVKSPDVALTLMQRQDELHDMINATSTAFLGLTVACARCHDHKLDPVRQADYYAFQASLAGVRHGDRPLPPREGDGDPRRLGQLRERIARLERQLAELEKSLPEGGRRRPPVVATVNEETFAPIQARRVRFTILATNNGIEPCIDELEIYTEEPARNVAPGGRPASSGNYSGSPKHRLEHINDGRYGNSHSWISATRGTGWVEIALPRPERITRIVWGRDREKKYADRLPTRYRIEVADDPEGGPWHLVASSDDRLAPGASPEEVLAGRLAGLSAEEAARGRQLLEELAALRAERDRLTRPALAYAGRLEQPGPTHLLYRGDPMARREEVPPGAVASLGASLELDSTTPEQKRRAALARWITDPANPLTARVIVNRVWMHHFGEGLVSTASDFGRMGAKPSHPELLDWLARDFMDHGWSLKHLHRRILQSNTWRQASRPRPEAVRVDAGTRLLWRYPPRRLEAEVLRDTILAVAGSLDLRMGGPGFSAFKPNSNYVRVYQPKDSFGPEEWRRMIYMTKVRMEPDATFGIFDCPDAGQVVARRSRSTTPLQALSLLNSPFILQQAGLFAQRLEREAGPSPPAQVGRAFELAFGRPPGADELKDAVALTEAHGLPALCRALFNASELFFLP